MRIGTFNPWLGRGPSGQAKQAPRGPARPLVGRAVPLALGVLSVALVLSGCGGSKGEETRSVVKTKRLEIVDDAGAARVVMTTIDGARPSLTLLDDKGNPRAWIFLSANGAPNLVLVDNPRLALLDGAGEIRSAQRLDEQGSPVFTQFDATGGIRSMLRLGQDGTPLLELYDASGRPIWTGK